MRALGYRLLVIAAVAGCSAESNSGDSCEALFGRPVDSTGLTSEQCKPECPCLAGWQAPTYDAAQVADLASRVLLDPPAPLATDPFGEPELVEEQPDKVCAVMLESGGYRVQTFESEAQATAAGGLVTHFGACGLCSSLQDLSVYIAYPDLTDPVRACGLEAITGGEEANLICLQELGFSLPCAQIWQYNTTNTRTLCLDVCLETLQEPYHRPDGSLNACLQCDEDNSGPVFKAVAGRTRRNTGLATALCRPCEEVHQIVHEYE